MTEFKRKSIAQQKEEARKKIGFLLNASWYFEKWYEKLILTAMGILSMIKIWEWIF